MCSSFLSNPRRLLSKEHKAWEVGMGSQSLIFYLTQAVRRIRVRSDVRVK